MTQETGRYADAKAFLAKLEFDSALLVGGVETSTDDSLPVPYQVKKQWHNWNCKNGAHPDKGGDTEAYHIVKGEYNTFKASFGAWLQAHPTGQPDFMTWCHESDLAEDASRRTKQKADIMEQGQNALQNAQRAFGQGRYEAAKEQGSGAVRFFEEYLSMSRVGGKETRELIGQANGLIGRAGEHIEQERQTQEQNRQQREEHQAYASGLEIVLGYVFRGQRSSGTPIPESIPEKFKALNASWEEGTRREEALKTEIASLYDEKDQMCGNIDALTRTHSEAASKWQQEKQTLERQVWAVQAENSTLKQELDDGHQASETESGGFQKVFDWITNRPPMKEKIDGMKRQLKLANEQLHSTRNELQLFHEQKPRLLEYEQMTEELRSQLKELQEAFDKSKQDAGELEGKVESGKTTIAEATQKLDALQEDVGQKEANIASLQAALDKAKQLQDEDRETLQTRRAEICAVKSAILAEILPGMSDCSNVAGELEAYFKDLQSKRNEKKFKVLYQKDFEPEEWRVIACSHECHDMFKQLQRLVSERFGLANDGLSFQYQDEDGDTISVCSSVELTEAILQFPSTHPKLILCQQKTSSKVLEDAGLLTLPLPVPDEA
jgi:DNA repair exonuclease SbcCD ATPase subunit